MELKRQEIAHDEKKTLVKEKTETTLVLETKTELLTREAIEYAVVGEQQKILEARRKTLRKGIEEEVSKFGIPDSNGHKVLELGPAKVTYQKRTKISLDEAAAEKLLKERGLWQSCTHEERRRVIDEEKIFHAYESGLLTPEDFDKIAMERESWALYVDVDEFLVDEYATVKNARKKYERET